MTDTKNGPVTGGRLPVNTAPVIDHSAEIDDAVWIDTQRIGQLPACRRETDTPDGACLAFELVDRRPGRKIDTGQLQRRFPFSRVEVFAAGFGTRLIVNKPKKTSRDSPDRMRDIGVPILPSVPRRDQTTERPEMRPVVANLNQ